MQSPGSAGMCQRDIYSTRGDRSIDRFFFSDRGYICAVKYALVDWFMCWGLIVANVSLMGCSSVLYVLISLINVFLVV